jgi:hypothetical protein
MTRQHRVNDPSSCMREIWSVNRASKKHVIVMYLENVEIATTPIRTVGYSRLIRINQYIWWKKISRIRRMWR